jgi:hypothetical protein
MRDGEPELETEICGGLDWSQGAEQLLHRSQSGKLLRAILAALQMPGDLLHALAGDCTVKVCREERTIFYAAWGGHRGTISDVFVRG